MPSQVTVTAPTGPAQTVTAAVLTNVTRVVFDIARQVAEITTNGVVKQFDINATDTITDSVVSGVHTIVINQS